MNYHRRILSLSFRQLTKVVSLSTQVRTYFTLPSISRMHAKLATDKAQRHKKKSDRNYEVKIRIRKSKKRILGRNVEFREKPLTLKAAMILASGISKPDWPVALQSQLS